MIDKAEGMHDDLAKQAQLLTSDGADAMAEVRKCADALELSVARRQLAAAEVPGDAVPGVRIGPGTTETGRRESAGPFCFPA